MSGQGIGNPPVQQIAVAVVRSRRGLLVQTRGQGEHLEGLLEFPGGKIEKGEAPLQAAIRETREEAGLTLDPASAREIGQQTHDYADRRVHLHFLLFDVADSVAAGEGTWIPARDLEERNFPPANRSVIRLLKTLIQPGGEREQEAQNHNDGDGPPES